MTSGVEDQLRAVFTSAEHDLPAEAFTIDVMARVRAHRQRTRVLQASAILITVVILWLLAPDIARGTVAAAGVPGAALTLARQSVRTLSESSLVSVLYLYGGVFAGYMLLKVLHQFRVRWV